MLNRILAWLAGKAKPRGGKMDYLQDTQVCLDEFFELLDLFCDAEQERDDDGAAFARRLESHLTAWRMILNCVMADDELSLSRKFAYEVEKVTEKAVVAERENVAIAEAMRRQRAEKPPSTDDEDEEKDE